MVVRIGDRDQELSGIQIAVGQSNYVPSLCGRACACRGPLLRYLIEAVWLPTKCGLAVLKTSRLQAGHDPRKILVGCDDGRMVSFPNVLHKVTQLHLTSCTVDAAPEKGVPPISRHTIGECVSGERLIALCPNGLCTLKFMVNNAGLERVSG
jgi:hypothetical protein